MVSMMKLHLKDLGPINEADINIGKITVVGGHNSTGKSTLSKFLYSFLRSNTLNRSEIASKSINDAILQLSRYISFYLRRRERSEKIHFHNPSDADNLENLVESYEEFKSAFNQLELPLEVRENITERFDKIDDLISITLENQTPLYISLIKSLLKSEFLNLKLDSYIEIENTSKNDSFKFIIDFKNHDFDDDESFKSQGTLMLEDVFYIDSIAILSIFDHLRYTETMTADHVDFLTKNLVIKPKDIYSTIFDDKINENIISIENEIKEIINGQIIFRDSKFYYESENGVSYDMINTASGIKQIGIIQVLLANRVLKENCVLIIDEPEVNLHPEWQFKLANILTLISKKLNVSLYINTHSPLFIESLNTFVNYYDMADMTTYHLTEKTENSKFNVKQVKENDLSKIYDELGKPYFEMDILRLEKEL